jgi:hypothetical protein
MVFAQSDLFGGMCAGGVLVGIIWLLYAAIKSQDSSREFYVNGYRYATKDAQRVFGCTGDRISYEGQWVCYIISLWRTYPNKWRKQNWSFFVMEIDELNNPKATPVSTEQAIAFLNKYAGQEAPKLIRDWTTERNDAQPVPPNNERPAKIKVDRQEGREHPAHLSRHGHKGGI